MRALKKTDPSFTKIPGSELLALKYENYINLKKDIWYRLWEVVFYHNKKLNVFSSVFEDLFFGEHFLFFSEPASPSFIHSLIVSPLLRGITSFICLKLNNEDFFFLLLKTHYLIKFLV